ncbi:MAG: hypothetical protein C0628_07060 [Sulfurimonas sp.]|nr:MAG: hypothetical protein C0628_07060 [Sulfurimonas sp.]
MREHKSIVLINGKESEIFYRKSRATKPKQFNLYTLEMLDVIEALLRGADSSFMYPKGITTLHYITSWNERELNIKRLSNKIIRLRDELPQSCLLTYRPLGKNEEWRYSLIKTAENVKALKDLRENILKKLGKQSKNHSNNLPTKTADR